VNHKATADQTLKPTPSLVQSQPKPTPYFSQKDYVSGKERPKKHLSKKDIDS
jgi:hypothetical protein